MQEDRVKSEYNQNQNINDRIAALTNDATKMLMSLRNDARGSLLYLDLVEAVWQEIDTVASMKENSATYKEDIDAMKLLKNELYSEAGREVRRAARVYGETLQTRGASEGFLLKAHKLKGMILTLAQRFGFGMSTKRFSNYDTASSIRRAAE